MKLLIRYFFILLLTLAPFVCWAEVDDSLLIQYHALDTVATYYITDADSIVSVMRQMPRGRSMEIRVWLTDDVSARKLVEGLNLWPDILGLDIYRGRAEVIDSVLALVVLPRLEGITLGLARVPSVPRHLSRFPHLTTLILNAIDGSWPCVDVDSVPNLERFWVYGPMRYTECSCVQKRQIVEGLPANPDLEFDYERLFILTGVYSDSTSVIDLFGSLHGSLIPYQLLDTIPVV